MRRRIIINKIFGIKSIKVVLDTIKDALKIYILSSIIVNLIFGFILNDKSFSLLTLKYIIQISGFSILINICIGIYLSICVLGVCRFSKEINTIKMQKSPFRHFVFSSKFVMFSVLIYIVAIFLSNIQVENDRLENINYWERTKDIYTLNIANWGDSSNIELERTVDNRLFKLYTLLKQDKNAFIMNAANFEIRGDSGNEGRYSYTFNTDIGAPIFSPYGESIDVSINYFNFNPIKSIKGIDVEDMIKNEDNVLNICKRKSFDIWYNLSPPSKIAL